MHGSCVCETGGGLHDIWLVGVHLAGIAMFGGLVTFSS